MDPVELVKLIEILNPSNRPGRITVITRMGADKLRAKLPHVIRAVRNAGQIVTWVTDPMHGNTVVAPCGLRTRHFGSIVVSAILSFIRSFICVCSSAVFNFLGLYICKCKYKLIIIRSTSKRSVMMRTG
jgi:3-deoxy-D-arabino-heptulosonate 7-phosphate (DAHP) synthase class II